MPKIKYKDEQGNLISERKDGTKVITMTSGETVTRYPDGTEITKRSDGTFFMERPNGSVTELGDSPNITINPEGSPVITNSSGRRMGDEAVPTETTDSGGRRNGETTDYTGEGESGGTYTGARTGTATGTTGRGDGEGAGTDATGRTTQDELNVQLGKTLKSIQDAFDKQFEWLKNKEEMWQNYIKSTEELLKNTPEYKIPDAVKQEIEYLEKASKEARELYEGASEEYKKEVIEGVNKAISDYHYGLNNMITAVQRGSSDAITSYEDAFTIAKEGSEALLKNAIEGGDAVAGKAGDYAKLMVDAAQGNIKQFDADAAGILETYKAGAEGLQQAGKQGLEARLEGAGNVLDMAKRQASQQLPGLDYLTEAMDADTAERVRMIKEYGGGSAGSLGAISDLYAQQQKSLQDVAIQNAIYRQQQQMNLQQTYGETGEMKGRGYDIYGQQQAQAAQLYGGAQQDVALQRATMGQNLVNTYGQAGTMEMAGQQYKYDAQGNAIAYGTEAQTQAQQKLGDVQSQQGLTLGNAWQNWAQGIGNAQLTGTQIKGQAIAGAADMRAEGLGKETAYKTLAGELGAGYADKAYEQNVLNPYLQNLAYNQNMLARTDPTAMQYGYYGDTAGVNYDLYQGNIEKDLYEKMINAGLITGGMSAVSNIFSSALGSIPLMSAITSSIEYKNDVKLNEYDSKNILNNLNVINFKYKPEFNINKEMVGIIAEDSPDIIKTDDGKAIDLSSLVGLLLDNIQRLNKEVEQLKNR